MGLLYDIIFYSIVLSLATGLTIFLRHQAKKKEAKMSENDFLIRLYPYGFGGGIIIILLSIALFSIALFVLNLTLYALVAGLAMLTGIFVVLLFFRKTARIEKDNIHVGQLWDSEKEYTFSELEHATIRAQSAGMIGGHKIMSMKVYVKDTCIFKIDEGCAGYTHFLNKLHEYHVDILYAEPPPSLQ